MIENFGRSSAAKSRTVKPSSASRHPAILRVSSLVVGGIISLLMVSSVVPSIVADQSDRAVVDAPVTLLTAPIDGEIDTLTASPGHPVEAGTSLARISNVRLDRGTLISLEEKVGDAREKLEAARSKKNSDLEYLASLDSIIAGQTEQLKAQFESQIAELRARSAASDSMSGEKKALVDRQTDMVARNAASIDMLRPTTQQYSAALHTADAEKSKLNQKIAQLDALQKGVYVGDDLIAIASLVQKRRDIDLDARRMEIESKELSGVLVEKQRLIDTEKKRLNALAEADVRAPNQGTILNVGAAPGRHVNAGDSVASLVDCGKRFVVAIFSYRQGESMKVGMRVHVDGGAFGEGVVTAVLPKTSDKIDERFAVPFPQTERRELYAIIAPANGGDRVGRPADTARDEETTSCAVGQWVTVTKDNGIVPSMSVTWRRVETLLTSWTGKNNPFQPNDNHEKVLEAGVAALASALRSAPQGGPPNPVLEHWVPRTEAAVSR